ncbi:MAG: Rpn family recombination-promoting nuclease/putative transposase [Treponema sp.]|nr:Rpn family recombination-promoting nuclease/putative transposase [Treponema sp.]
MSIEEFKSEEEYVSQAGSGALLNPRIDSTFKALFTRPTAESRAALLSFLEAATERSVKDFKLTANDAPEEFSGQRRVNYDIACEFNDGQSADIEMQAFNQKYDYGKRAEYQVARLETTYLKKGDGWEKAPTVYQITVLDFEYDSQSDAVVSRYAMRTKDGRELSNALNVIFIDLIKAKSLEKKIDTNTKLENWAVFLKDADNPRKTDVIHRLTTKEDGLMQAQKSLSSISADRDLWFAQYRQEIFERDRISSMNASLREGREKGLAEGRAKGLAEGRAKGLAEGRAKGLVEGREKGLAEGRAEGKKEIAKSMLDGGMEIRKISLFTGLSEEEIEALR